MRPVSVIACSGPIARTLSPFKKSTRQFRRPPNGVPPKTVSASHSNSTSSDVGASAQPEGAFLNARVVGDEAFYAQVRALSGLSNDIAAVYEQMEEISAALSSGPPALSSPPAWLLYQRV
jgi:hypothetical protein